MFEEDDVSYALSLSHQPIVPHLKSSTDQKVYLFLALKRQPLPFEITLMGANKCYTIPDSIDARYDRGIHSIPLFGELSFWMTGLLNASTTGHPLWGQHYHLNLAHGGILGL